MTDCTQGGSASGWISLAEAASILGLSVDAVRKRVKRRELQAKKVDTQRGPAWRVLLSDDGELAPGPARQLNGSAGAHSPEAHRLGANRLLPPSPGTDASAPAILELIQLV